LPVRHLSLSCSSAYRFRFREDAAVEPVGFDGDALEPIGLELHIPKDAGGLRWSSRGLEQGVSIPAWMPLAEAPTPWGSATLAMAADVRVLEGYDRRAPARLEVTSPWRPAPDALTPRQVWLRHFAWLRFRDPVAGGPVPATLVPDRLFVSLFDPEPLAAPAVKPAPAEVLAAIAAWHRAMETEVPVTLIVSREQARVWKTDEPGFEPDEVGFELDVLATDAVYPAHHPGLALARRLYPYGFDRLRYAWTDWETLALFEAALARRPEAGTIPMRLQGGTVRGVARLAPWSRIDPAALGCPAGALLVQGGLLTGTAAGSAPVVHPADRAWTLMTADDRREFLWFMNPGFARDSSSPLFASHYLPWVRRELGAGLRGERRFCIACNRCEVHCPAGLDPQHLWKCLRKGFDAEAVEHGLRRCLECGLCSYACPSKIELADEFRQARAKARRARTTPAAAAATEASP